MKHPLNAMTRSALSGIAGLLILGVIAIAPDGPTLGSPGEASFRSVDRTSGRAHHQSFERIAPVARAQMEQMERIAGRQVAEPEVQEVILTTAAEVGREVDFDTNSSSADLESRDRLVRLVRARGTFVGQRIPPGVKPIESSSGFLVVDDDTGDVLGMGMP